jgi:NAD(P)H-hydrate repair Nnr-like enzyme with NAD(P)H-hydrate dehydratase domain
LTPNKVEFDRLVQALVNELDGTKKNNAREEDETLECNNPSIDPFSESLRAELLSKDPVVSARAVSLALGGVPVLAKGEKDIFTAGGDVFEMNQPLGSPRRCGGQGDILAGTLGVAVFWGNQVTLMIINF